MHPSGLYTAHATNSITASATNYDTLTTTFEANGNITNRTWKSAKATNTQTFVFDARSRLSKVIERDTTQSGRNWSAVYDVLNRLLRTTDTPVINGVTNSGEAQIVDHYYDPE